MLAHSLVKAKLNFIRAARGSQEATCRSIVENRSAGSKPTESRPSCHGAVQSTDKMSRCSEGNAKQRTREDDRSENTDPLMRRRHFGNSKRARTEVCHVSTNDSAGLQGESVVGRHRATQREGRQDALRRQQKLHAIWVSGRVVGRSFVRMHPGNGCSGSTAAIHFAATARTPRHALPYIIHTWQWRVQDTFPSLDIRLMQPTD